MTCDEAREQLAGYAYDQLELEIKEKMDAHLTECVSCRAELTSLRKVLSLTKVADNSTFIQFANGIIRTAIQRRASDIHIERERMNGAPRVRYRIDGALQPGPEIDEDFYEPLLSRIKILAEMNVAETRMPQDGRMPFSFDGKEFDIRVSMFPYVTGESAVMRILDRSNVLIGMDQIGMSRSIRERVESLVTRPSGLFIVCGPTGSGKTTTLYSILQMLNHAEKKIMTIEDPVEFLLPGVNQGFVNAKIGVTFAVALRTMLRQDPDIMMVGDARDQETIQIAMQAALTGHLVLMALAPKNAVEGLKRMTDIISDAYLVADSVSGVLAQRLVRRICPDCKRSYAPTESEWRLLGFERRDAPDAFYRGEGCESCQGTGYKGRSGLYELLTMNPQLGEAIREDVSVEKMRVTATESGALSSFIEDARAKAFEGITTVEEIERTLKTLR